MPDGGMVEVVEGLTTRERYNHLHAMTRHGNYHNYYSFRTASSPDERLTAAKAGGNNVLSYCKDKTILDLGCNAGKLSREVIDYGGAKKAIGVDIDAILIQQAVDLGVELKDDPNKITFIVGDFMKTDYFTEPETRIAQPSSLFQLLPHGGILVVEPQEWENYKAAVKKNKELRTVFKTLKMKPGFEPELKEVGFSQVETIEREEGG